MRGLAPKPDGVLQSSVSGCNSFTGDIPIYILLSVSGIVLRFAPRTVFSGCGIPWGYDVPEVFSAGVCFGVVAFSLPQTKKFPPTWASESWAFPTLSPLAATVFAEEPRSRGQLLTPCQFGMRPPVKRELSSRDEVPGLFGEHFILDSFSCTLRHSCVVCLPG